LRDLSLHLLDLLENCTRAGARTVELTLSFDPRTDRLGLSLQDDGPGLPVTAAQALDPFYTTKQGKRTGLGLPLFAANVEQAGGRLALSPSPSLGGLRVDATLVASHVDRLPLGDVPGTLFSILLTHPELTLRCLICQGEAVQRLERPGSVGEGTEGCEGWAEATEFMTKVQEALQSLRFPN